MEIPKNYYVTDKYNYFYKGLFNKIKFTSGSAERPCGDTDRLATEKFAAINRQ